MPGALRPAVYGYRIDLDERGSFRASVTEDDGHDLFDVTNEDSEDGSLWLIEDGFMRHANDLTGLTSYLVELGIIARGSRIMPMAAAERWWADNGGKHVSKAALRAMGRNPAQFSKWNSVRVGADEIHEWRKRWPASGLPEGLGVTFEFDRTGLVDLTWDDGEYHEEADGAALVALSQDAQDGKVGSLIPPRGVMRDRRKRR